MQVNAVKNAGRNPASGASDKIIAVLYPLATRAVILHVPGTR